MAQVKPTNNKKKMSKASLAALIVTIAILLGLVVSLLSGTGLFVRIQKGASSEHFKVNGSMMTYYANSYYQNWYSDAYYYIIFGMIKFDPSKPLDEQLMADGKTTYYDYFTDGAKNTVTTYLKYCEAAMADSEVNYDEIKAEAEEHAEESIDSLRKAAKENSMSLQAYIRQYMGEYVSVRDLRKALVIENIASHYYQEVYDRTFDSITEEREDKFFEENLSSFISAEYLSYTLSSTVTPVKVDETKYEGGKESQEYKDAVAKAEADAKAANEAAKIADKEKLDKLATAKNAEEFKQMLLELKYDETFNSTYDTAVKNFVAADKPSDEEKNAYKAELKDKVIAAVLAGKEDLTADEPETTAEGEEAAEKTKWEKAKETFPKSLIAALKSVITTNTKTATYGLTSDLEKFLFGGVKDHYGIEYKEGEEKGHNADLYEKHFEDKEITADADKAIGKYSMTLYFVTETAHRDEYSLRDVGHILFKVDSKGTNGAYKTSDEAKAAAEKLLEEIKATAVNGVVEKEVFEAMAKDTHDSNVFYDDVAKNQMVDEFEDWLFAATTKGEVGLVYHKPTSTSDYEGWHIVYYGGETGEQAWRPTAHDGAAAEEMDAWFEKLPYEVEINSKILDKVFK